MVKLEFSTIIAAPIERCFDLARSIDFHLHTSVSTGEVAIAGKMSGLIGLHETVTWRGRHLGFRFEHESLIDRFDRPHHFRDVMVRGSFKSFQHDHFFAPEDGGTWMRDVIEFTAPCGLLGRFAESLLSPYVRRFMRHRVAAIKAAAESEQWQRFL
jgi:ligand-binding SRPBCC domain-containing protein